MQAKKFIHLALILLAIAAFAVAQDSNAQQAQPSVKHVSLASSSASSGAGMFKSYCAVCHGTDGKGNGPAASALKTPPPDVTVLAKNNGGKYPSAHIASVIRGQASLAPHGTQEMPVWGPLFSSISQGNQAQVQQRIANLVSYIQSLQAK